MLKSLRNHQLSQPTRGNGGLLVADVEKKIGISWSLNRLQFDSVPASSWDRESIQLLET